MTAYERLIARLEEAGSRVRRTGSSATAQCPAHDDKNPSLSLRQIEGQALMRCHAGCDTADVVAALGLGLGDLFDEPSGARYDYRDLAGTVVRSVYRTPDKKFRQSGQTKGTASLYRLPEVVAAVAAGKTIYLTEGEKDVAALESLGLVGTTAPMGAANWGKVDPSPLFGAKVVVVVDRDEAGARWAEQVRESLAERAELTLVQAAAGKDFADHLIAGHGVEDLAPFELEGSQAPPIGPSVVTLADVHPERVSWLWPGRLPAGKLVVIDGDPSTGKSTLTLDLAAHVSTGKPWPDGAASDAGDVLLLSAEDGLADTISPRLVAAGADRKRVHALTEVPIRNDDGEVRVVPPSLPRDIPLIRGIVEQRSIRLVVVDVLMAFLASGVDSHRDQDVRGVLHQLAAMAEATGCTIILIRHLNKAGGSNALYRGGGSIGIVGAARAAFLVARDPEDEGRRIFAVTKCNLAAEPPALAYRLVDNPTTGCARVEWAGTVDYTAAALLRTSDPEDATESGEAAEWLTEYLGQHGGTESRKEIVRAAKVEGISEKVLRRAREKAQIEVQRSGFPSTTFWSLAPVVPTKPQSGPPETVGTTAKSGHDCGPAGCRACGEDGGKAGLGRRGLCVVCELAAAPE